MLRPGSLRWATTQSMPAMTWVTSTAPSRSATLTLSRLASGATPTNFSFLSRSLSFTPGSRPAMIPAMWVPCPKVSMLRGGGVLGLEGQVRAVGHLARRGP